MGKEVDHSLISSLCDNGELLENMGQYEEAIACYQKVAKISPEAGKRIANQIKQNKRLKGYTGTVRIGGETIELRW